MNRLLLGIVLLFSAAPASAHPHVWATAETTVLYEHGAVSGLQHTWTFDEFYTAMAIEGLDTNNDGIYDRQELAELAQTNIEGMQDLGYFTVAKLGDSGLKFKPPIDYWLEYKDGILTLHFTLPLEQPVTADANAFSFAIFDPSFFIAFTPAKTDPVKLGAGAPPECKATTALPEKDAAEIQRLGEAFPLGGPTFGMSVAATGSVQCPKS
jgi:ABC-type uncharacterized transport system substrate-binding protein